MIDRIIIILAVAFCAFILIFTDYGKTERVYDCRISEISPDFPPEVREECRKLRREYYNEHQKNNSRHII